MNPRDGGRRVAGSGGAVVGRSAELAELTRCWGEARAGSPQVVLVEAEAGAGKTTLIRTFLEQLDAVPVLWASCDELETDLTFGVAAQLLGADPSELVDAGDALSIGAAMIQALSDREQDGPVVVVVDDLGWADLPSMQAMAFALRRLHSDPVLVLLTVRPELRKRLPDSIIRVVESRGAVVALDGLSSGDLGDLVAALGLPDLPSRTLDRLVEHTRGSPLHALALLHELDGGAMATGDLTPIAAPSSYSDLVERQVEELDGQAERLATAASVLGMYAPLPLVAELARIAEPAAALDQLVASGLVTVARLPLHLEVRFSHPLTRAAIYHATAMSRRSALHLDAADALAAEGDSAGSLRHRALAVPGTDAALSAELAAYADATRRRPAGAAPAAGWYQIAARLAEDTATREDLVLRAVESLVIAGDAAAAQELAAVFDSFADSARKGYLVGALLLARGQYAPAVASFRQAWELVDESAEPDLAGAIAGALTVVQINTAQLDEAVAWARRAVELSSTDNVLGSSPRAVLPVALAASGRYDDALASSEPVPVGDHDVDPEGLQRLTGRGAARLWTDDLEGSYADLRRAARLARDAGVFLPYSVALCYLSDAEFLLGKWDDSRLHAELIASVAQDLDQTWFLAMPYGAAALGPANRGEWAVAEAHVSAALAVADEQGDAASVMWARTAEATLATARGDHARALAAARACLEHPGIGRVREAGVKPWRVLGAEACAALGELDLVDDLLTGIGGGFARTSLAIARARGLVAAARGDHDEATRCFDEAAEHLDRCEDPFERAKLHLANGAHLRRRGRRRQAVAALTRAREGFVALQALPWIERADAELSVSGISPSTPDSRRSIELTPQEQAIVRLAVDGRRNRDIATELFISVKTVEYHLGNAYRKLGISRRTQLARACDEALVS